MAKVTTLRGNGWTCPECNTHRDRQVRHGKEVYCAECKLFFEVEMVTTFHRDVEVKCTWVCPECGFPNNTYSKNEEYTIDKEVCTCENCTLKVRMITL